MKSLFLAVICLSSFLAVTAPADARAATHHDGLTLIVVDAPDIEALHAAKDFVESRGGRVGVMAPPSILIGWLDPASAPGITGRHGIREIRWSEAPVPDLGPAGAQAESAVRSFNTLVSGRYDRERGRERASFMEASLPPRIPDGVTRPDVEMKDVIANLDRAGLDAGIRSRLGFAPEAGAAFGNSDAMTGTVAVTFFLVESNGSGADPDQYTWTIEDMQKYLDSAVDGLLWWVQAAGAHRDCWVTFLVNHYSGFDARCQQWVEPANHTSGYVSVWSSNVMANFGYTSGSHFSRVEAFNTWQRAVYQTNRAYSAFIAYNPIGAPTAFADGGYAFAWLYGPYFWSLFRTVGWTRDVVVSHESGHIFGACDEYIGGCSTCSETCDLQGTPNANCEACNPLSRGCMMRSNENALCQYTKSMVGWDALTPCAPSPPPPLPAPTVAGITPGQGLQGGEVTFDVSGTNFVAGAQADLGSGVFVHETEFVDATTLTVWASVLNTTPAGFVDVVVRNRDGQAATLADGFEVLPTIHHYYSPTGANQFPYTTPATAGHSLADVIGAASEGDIVRVPSMTLSNFQLVVNKAVMLEGAWDATFTTRDLAAGRTVLDLNGMVDFLDVAGGGLDGFALQNGDGRYDVVPVTARFAGAVRALNSTISLVNCEIRDSAPGPLNAVGYGGAIFAYQSTLTIDNCQIHGNSATRGGALYLEQCAGSITNTSIADNHGVTDGSWVPEGSGVYLTGCANLSIVNCSIVHNGGGQNGGGVLAENCSAIAIQGGVFEHNQASYGGGAIAFKSTSGTIAGSRIARNAAVLGGGAWLTATAGASVRLCAFEWNTGTFGGGLLADGAILSVDHNLFVGNTASNLIGGAGLAGAGGGSVIGNTFDRNTAAGSAGGLSLSGCTVPVFNNIVANSTSTGIACSGSPATYFDENNVWNSSGGDYSGCAPGPGAISQDPAFADTANGDYHLAVNSPCIDRGRPGAAYLDPDGSRGDMGRYGSHAHTMDQPAYPKNLVIEPNGGGAATLRWNAAVEPDVIQYAVYRDPISGFTPGASSLFALVAAPDTFLVVDPADSLCYRVSAVDASGYGSGYSDEACGSPATAVDAPAAALTRLLANVPNPFNPTTTIRFELATTERVRLSVYDVAGREVAVLVDGVRGPGRHDVRWDATDSRGVHLASGVYFYRLATATFSETRKMALLK